MSTVNDNELATIKRPQQIEYISKEEYKRRLAEIVRCSKDICYFAEKYFKIINLDKGLMTIELYPKQNHLLNFFVNEKRCIVLASRQSSKTTTYTIYLLWLTMFHADKKVMILANKLDTCIEICGRISMGYQYLPSFLKPGVVTFNKSELCFSNRSVIKGFATSSDAARGFSANCVTGDTMVTIADDYDNIYYVSIDKVDSIYSNSSNICKQNMIDEVAYMENKKYYYVYKITNMLNNYEYIGFHSTNDIDDGYMGSGKILKQSIAKHGIQNFKKEIIQIFDNRKDAEDLERKLVNEDYVKRDDTYNISLGGNVCILYGKDNGFYGKKHSDETKQKIRESWDKNRSERIEKMKGVNQTTEDDVIINGKRYNSRQHAMKELDICIDKLNNLLIEDGNGFINEERQRKHIEFMNELKIQKQINHNIHLERIREACRNPLRNKKISDSLSGRKHSWNDKINKNPEKIRKTAEKHRGMKRSEEAKMNMSKSLKEYYAFHDVSNKGKIWIHNTLTNKKKYIEKTSVIPEGWELGMGKRGN